MRVPFLDLRSEVGPARDGIVDALEQVMADGRFLHGPYVTEFEQAFARYCGVAQAVGVASGTDALGIALSAAGVGPGDEVITQANTCVPTVAAIASTNAQPVLVDPDPVTFTLDPSQLSAALTERTRAIVPVHLYGQCAEMEPIIAFARAYDLLVVEDAAQAHGAEYRGRRAGSLADVAAFSFYPTKNLAALGDAGAVTTDDPDIAQRARLLAACGQLDGRPAVLAGRTSRLDAIQAAILLAGLAGLDAAIARRRELAARYRSALSAGDLGLPDEGPDRRHVWHLFVVRHDNRDGLARQLADRGVGTKVHYPVAIHRHPAWNGLARGGELQTSDALAGSVVSLPLHPALADADVDFVIAAVNASLAADV